MQLGTIHRDMMVLVTGRSVETVRRYGRAGANTGCGPGDPPAGSRDHSKNGKVKKENCVLHFYLFHDILKSCVADWMRTDYLAIIHDAECPECTRGFLSGSCVFQIDKPGGYAKLFLCGLHDGNNVLLGIRALG